MFPTHTRLNPARPEIVSGAQISEPKNMQVLRVTAPSNTAQQIQKALELLSKGVPVKLLFSKGTWRQDLGHMHFEGRAFDTLLVIEGAPLGQTVVSGADLVDPDSWLDCGAGLFKAPWRAEKGFFGDPWFPVADAIGWKGETAFLDGEPLFPVTLEEFAIGGFWDVEVEASKRGQIRTEYTGLRQPKDALKPGQWGLTTTPENGDWLYLRLEDKHHPKNHKVEVGVRETLLTLHAKKNLVLRNIVFSQAVTYPKENRFSGLRMPDTYENVLVDKCRAVWNGAMGFQFNHITNFTIRNTISSYNGFGGIGCSNLSNFLMEDSETSCNDWRNFIAGKLASSHCTAGIKVHQSKNVLVRRHTALANQINGIWFDIACSNVTVEDSVCAWNRRQGLFYEFSPGPFLARRNLLAANGDHSLFIDTVGDAEISHNLIWADQPLEGNHGTEAGGANIGQGMRLNDHYLLSFTASNQLEFVHNLVASGSGSQSALFSLFNRIRDGQDTIQEIQAMHAFPAASFEDENHIVTSKAKPFYYEDVRRLHKSAATVSEWNLWRLKAPRSSMATRSPWGQWDNAQIFLDPARLDFRTHPESRLTKGQKKVMGSLGPKKVSEDLVHAVEKHMRWLHAAISS